MQPVEGDQVLMLMKGAVVRQFDVLHVGPTVGDQSQRADGGEEEVVVQGGQRSVAC